MPHQTGLVVVGGGAAGFFGAIRAKILAPDLPVTILEAAARPLGKVRISGGGRCNVTHACFDPQQLIRFYPRGHRELRSVFARFGPADTLDWFAAHGVSLKTEPDGRVFPVTDTSQTILDCLMSTARKAGITVVAKTPVLDLRQTPDGLEVLTEQDVYHASFVLLAPGASRKASAWLTRLGHTLVPPVPSLFTFQITHPLLTDLAGISLPKVQGTLIAGSTKPISQTGPLLITHWGLSGPVVLRLSAWGARALHETSYQAQLVLDFCPDLSLPALEAVMSDMQSSAKHVGNACPVDFPKRLWERFLQVHSIPETAPWREISRKTRQCLAESLKKTVLTVHGKGAFKEEFVTAGGVRLSEITMQTMASRQVPGLYLAGEIIDVDGLTGGFNFQNAWSTGWLAGTAIAEAARDGTGVV